MHIRFRRPWMAAAALLTGLAGGLSAQSPIMIGDGSVCLSDAAQEFPNSTSQQHERAFVPAGVWVETTPGKKACEAATECAGSGCRAFEESVKAVTVDYRQGNLVRQLVAVFDNGVVRLTSVGVPFNQWQNAAPNRRRVLRNGKIERITVDGQPIACPPSAQCRVTIRQK
jgi:hypothetical protein